MKETKVTKQTKENAQQTERKTKITNVYKGISTEERIRIYLKICSMIYEQPKER